MEEIDDNGEERQKEYHNKVRAGYIQFHKEMYDAYMRYNFEQQKGVIDTSFAGRRHLINQRNEGIIRNARKAYDVLWNIEMGCRASLEKIYRFRVVNLRSVRGCLNELESMMGLRGTMDKHGVESKDGGECCL